MPTENALTSDATADPCQPANNLKAAAITGRDVLLHTIFQSVSECVKVFDKQGNFLAMNRAGLEMVEVDSFDEVEGESALAFIAPEYHAAMKSINSEVLKGHSGRAEYEVIGKKGGRRFVESQSVPLSDTSGEITGILSITRDMTPTRDAKIAIRESHERFRRMVEQLPAGAIAIEGEAVFFNRTTEEILGYSSDEIATLDDWFSLLYRERSDEVRQLYEADKVDGFPGRREIKVTCKSGEIKTVEFAGYVDRESEIWVLHDVTERKKAEEAVKLRERQLSTLMSNLPGAAYRCLNDEQWTMEFISDGCEQVCGYSANEITDGSPTWAEFMHPDDRERVWNEVQISLKEHRSFQFVYRIHHRSGQERFVWEQGQGVFASDGQLEAIEGFMTDITELEQTKQQLVQGERLAAMGKMLSALAHESRNALQRIQSGVEMLKFEFDEASESYEDLRRIAGAREDLQRLYDEMRSFAAPMNLQISDCDLSGIWKKAWTHLEPAWKPRAVRLIENTADSDPVLPVDSFRLEQVFRNLLENSLAACSDPIQIEIECVNSDVDGQPGVCVSLRDNGPGLTEEQRSRIFEAFFTTKHKGTGLGMAIAKRIVEAHRGTIEARNSSSGGAEFVLKIPRAKP
ncbi:PAS domain-containing sensor histidine kinase [Crateriforma spongiae]|uniref:PAS domain-containing sensor histidine kinase n=1 Tax=Crateriforma spongiae TaxID=2724528 RepID=UPI001F356469|nr:PAS domain-containing sensor histidine kinase [Crateriforma spongiae]